MTRSRLPGHGLAIVAVTILGFGCGGTHRVASADGGQERGGGNGGGGAGGGSGGSGGGGASGAPDDPATCALAAASRSYVGCDFWPTPLANSVDKTFDFTAVVANAGTDPADVTVTGPGGTSVSETVPPREVRKLYLPWVPELQFKAGAPAPSAKVKNGAFHLTSSRPITAYQFNPLEYKEGAGPSGKDWSKCVHNNPDDKICLSYTNDASLLIPSTAMTGNYRVGGYPSDQDIPSYFGITGTENGTEVTIKLSATAKVAAGGGLPAAEGGGTFKLTLDAGEVAQIVGSYAADVSGTLVSATKPVQVISGHFCAIVPGGFGDCDHIEETVMPIETMGTKYHVTVPTGPDGVPVAHAVRIFGNSDGTTLTYAPAAPAGAPTTIAAGQVVDLGIVKEDFEVRGTKAFSVGSFMVGNGYLYPMGSTGMIHEGDPSQTTFAAVEQYRKVCVFLAPDDYDISFADVTTRADATLVLDDVPVSVAPTPIGDTGYGVFRLKLGPGAPGGGHVITSSEPAGLQVMGYGLATSYQYPGGLNLRRITTAP